MLKWEEAGIRKLADLHGHRPRAGIHRHALGNSLRDHVCRHLRGLSQDSARRYACAVGLENLESKNTRHQVKLEFQIKNIILE